MGSVLDRPISSPLDSLHNAVPEIMVCTGLGSVGSAKEGTCIFQNPVGFQVRVGQNRIV